MNAKELTQALNQIHLEVSVIVLMFAGRLCISRR